MATATKDAYLAIPRELHARLKKLAKQRGRTMRIMVEILVAEAEKQDENSK